MISKELLTNSFKEAYGASPELIAFAPGRVNLIGEHTDYNGGHVLPCALSLGVLCAAKKRDDGLIRLTSLGFKDEGVLCFDIEGELPQRSSWALYPMGVLRALNDAGCAISHGADLMFVGDIPAGSGLSSSAAVEVAAALALCGLNGVSLEVKKLARICQRAENVYVGVNCGIMDQFASAAGRRDNALFLNTATLEYEYVPFELGSAELIIVNSKCKHSLAGSQYNLRRQQCEAALKLLEPKTHADALCHISPEIFEASKDALNDPVLLKRARHAVYEEARTLTAVKALRAGDIKEFGRLMNGSHVSLRDDYEVSCFELDVLTELAWETSGVLGARMTGGGFGGCMVSIVEKDGIDEFTARVGSGYLAGTGVEAEFYRISPADGASLIN